jgi:hypothetical protein
VKALLLRFVFSQGQNVAASLLASIFASDPILVEFFRAISVRFETLMSVPSRKG